MRKTLALLTGGFLLIAGCNKSTHHDDGNLVPEEEVFTATQRKCAADEKPHEPDRRIYQ